MSNQEELQNPEELDDKELYRQYQIAKQEGPQPRLDALQLEIAQRWEQSIDKKYRGIDVEYPHE